MGLPTGLSIHKCRVFKFISFLVFVYRINLSHIHHICIHIFSHERTNRSGPGERGTWSGAATRNIDYFGGSNEVAVNITDDPEKEAAKQAVMKERPVWMTESTIGEVNIEDQASTDLCYIIFILICQL